MLTKTLTWLLTGVTASNVTLSEAATIDSVLSKFLPQHYDIANRIAFFEAQYDPYVNQEINNLGDDTYQVISYAYLPDNETSVDNHSEIVTGEPALADIYATLLELNQMDVVDAVSCALSEDIYGTEEAIRCGQFCNSPHYKCSDSACPRCRYVGGRCKWQRHCE